MKETIKISDASTRAFEIQNTGLKEYQDCLERRKIINEIQSKRTTYNDQ